MTTTVVSPDCVCGGLIEGLRQCPEHFRLYNGPNRLASVRAVVRLLPSEPCNVCGATGYKDHAPGCMVFARIEEAKIRGLDVNRCFDEYVAGRLTCYPAGLHPDTPALCDKLFDWLEKQNFGTIETQLLVGDDEVGGILDIRVDGDFILELKATHTVSDAHVLQAAGYAELARTHRGAVLHVAKRFKEPKLTMLTDTDCEDWLVLRRMYAMAKRRSGVKEEE